MKNLKIKNRSIQNLIESSFELLKFVTDFNVCVFFIKSLSLIKFLYF